jgi:hypothetical protein
MDRAGSSHSTTIHALRGGINDHSKPGSRVVRTDSHSGYRCNGWILTIEQNPYQGPARDQRADASQ